MMSMRRAGNCVKSDSLCDIELYRAIFCVILLRSNFYSPGWFHFGNLFKNVCLEAFGYALPPNIITSASLEEKLSALY